MDLKKIISTLSMLGSLVPLAYGNQQSAKPTQCPPPQEYSVKHSARGIVKELYADIYDISGSKVRTQQIVVDPKGVRAMSALVLAEGETAQLYGEIYVPTTGKDGKTIYNKVEGRVSLDLPNGTGNLDNILDSSEVNDILSKRVNDVVARARAAVIGYDPKDCQIASLLQEIIVVPKDRPGLFKSLIKLQTQLAEYSKLGEERFEQILINYAGIMDKLTSIEERLEQKPIIEPEQAPTIITPSKTHDGKSTFELGLNYSHPDSLEASLSGALFNGNKTRLILGLSGATGLKESSLGPIRAQDHSWYSDKYDQTLRSTTDLMGSYTPQQIAALFQLEFGRQNGFRAGIEGRAGIEFRNLNLSLAKEIKCLDNGNTIEYSVLDLGKADYHAFFTEALGYVKVPVSKHIDLYVAGGARNSPRIFVDKINGQAIITNVGPENGVELYEGGIKPVAKAGLNFRF